MNSEKQKQDTTARSEDENTSLYNKVTWWLMALIFLAAFLPRIVCLAELYSDSPTYNKPEGGDSILYDRIASGSEEPRRAYFHSPLYRTYLAGLYGLFGRNLTLVRIIQHFLGAVTAVLVFVLSLRLFKKRKVAVCAGLLFALSGPLLLYESQLLVDGLLPLLTTLGVLILLWFLDRPSMWKAALVGAVIALGALGRPTQLIWLPILLVWIWAFCHDKSRRLVYCALFVAGFVAIILPVSIRNYVVERDLVAITSNGGLNLFVGNNPMAQGTYNLPAGLWFEPGIPTEDFRGEKEAAKVLGGQPKSSEVSAWWRGQALSYMADNPGRTVKLMLIKARLMLSDYELPQLYNLYGYSEISSTLKILPTAGFLIAPALLGMLLCLSFRDNKESILVILMTSAYAASFLPFFVVGRYRVALLGLAAPFAGYALFFIGRAFSKKDFRRSALTLIGLAVFTTFVFLPHDVHSSLSPQFYFFGNASITASKPRQAIHWFERAVQEDPNNSLAYANLGIAYNMLGQYPDSLDALTHAARLYPKSAKIRNNIGLVFRKMDKLDQAEKQFRRAIHLDPDQPEAYVNLGEVLISRGKMEMAEKAFQTALDLTPKTAPWRAALKLKIKKLERSGSKHSDP